MFISDLPNTKNLHSAVIQELRSHGIKYRVKKPNNKHLQNYGGAIFGTALHKVPQKTVVCCGVSLLVPALVHEACCFLRAFVHIEGLFRKAGSQTRQRDIKRLLETGCKIDKSCHAVDIAGILKLYLRVLPEPLLGEDIQEVLLRCLLISDNLKLSAIQNALLLLPMPYLDVLHYIMEFFRYVASKSEANKMDSNNLAIVLAPSVMPLPTSYPPKRMEQHVKLVKILIENANMIGCVPLGLLGHLEEDLEREEEKTKKKRRSGSLTRMLNGLRKMVSGNSNQHKATTPDFLATPVLDKCTAKRKQDAHLGFSAKKRKEILSGLPQQPLCTPVRSLGEKEFKKLRLSIGRKPKDKSIDYKMTLRDIPPSEPVLNKSIEDNKFTFPNGLQPDLLRKNKQNDFVTISKSEYESIKQRVSAIECRISQEFNVMTAIDHTRVTEPIKQVQSAYEKTCEEAANLASPTAEQLAKRLSRELKIRRSDEHKIIRSPSARKIGTIRRRSRENVTKLTRTQTWNVSSHTATMNNNPGNEYFSQVNLKRGRPNTLNTGLTHPTSNQHPPAQNNTLLKRRMSVNGAIDSDPIENTMSHAYLTRNQLKRTSYHGDHKEKSPQIVKEKKVTSANEISWKSAKSFLSSVENIENHQTGRASVAKLRSQNVGMVLAKARLFDGMTDSDTSLEKKVVTKQTRHTGFARKPRKNINDSQNRQMFSSASEIDTSNSLVDNKNIRKVCKSPNYVTKRVRPKTMRSPANLLAKKENLNLSTQLKDVIYDVCTPMSEKISIAHSDRAHTPSARTNMKLNAGCRTPRNCTPVKKINKNLIPMKNIKLSQNTIIGDGKKQNTPLRGNHSTPRRQSPRLTSIKSRYNN